MKKNNIPRENLQLRSQTLVDPLNVAINVALTAFDSNYYESQRYIE